SQLQLARRHGAVVGLGCFDTNYDRSRTYTHMHDAAWFAFECAGNETVLSVHDGRHARRDRHAHVESCASLHRHQRQREWSCGTTEERNDEHVDSLDAWWSR